MYHFSLHKNAKISDKQFSKASFLLHGNDISSLSNNDTVAFRNLNTDILVPTFECTYY